MPRCFVIQPFDRGVFDKRYTDVLEPAILAANLEPYRVDRDPSASILIDSIERGIRDAEVCLAEISTNNPNVWFELGFAIACEKEVVLVCATPRPTPFPFDIRHRHIIEYTSESASDFTQLGKHVSERLSAAMKKERSIAQLSESPLAPTGGLQPHEIAVLVTVMEAELESPLSGWSIKQHMEKAGYTGIAAVLAVKRLLQMQMIHEEQVTTRDDEFTGHRVTSIGQDWLLRNQETLSLRKPPSKGSSFDSDDDLPF